MIYLDNSATTKQRHEVTEIMMMHMEECFGNPSSLYQLGVDSEKSVKKARKQLASAMGNQNGNVCFTSGGTEADNMAIFGIARALKRSGRKIVTSAVEHPAVLECCKRLEAEGFEVEYIGVDSKCRLDIEHLENAIDEETILVSLMHVNNEAGTVMPVEKVKSIMSARHAPGVFHCDAVQSFGKLQLPGEADLISVSGHKIHGPKGSGALYIRKNVNMPAFIVGGGQESGRRSGTENVPAIAGLGLAAEIAGNDRVAEMNRIAEMRQSLMDGFRAEISDMIINSPEEAGEKSGQCCPSVLSVSFLGTRGEVLLHTLEQDGIYVSTGSACSSNKPGLSSVIQAIGTEKERQDSNIRFSMDEFITKEDIDYVIKTLNEAVPFLRQFTRR